MANVSIPDMVTGGYFVKMDYARRHDYEGSNQPKQGPAMDLYTSSDSISITGSTASGGAGNTGYAGTGATGAGGTGATSASGTGNTSAASTVSTWRPLANLGNICTKD
jgi:hypothetical protein